jgi:hypothetical protein
MFNFLSITWRGALVGSVLSGTLFALTSISRVAAGVPAAHGALKFVTQHILGGGDPLARGMALALLAGGVVGAILSVIAAVAGARSSASGGHGAR